MWAITVALLCAAIFVLGIAFWVYYRDIVTEELSPNRWSWLIWTIEMWMQAVTYEGLNNDLVKSAAIFVAAIGCTAVFVRTWQRAAWKKPNPTETVCVLMSVAALVVWVGFGSVFWAHYLVVGAVPIAFLPTWQNAWRHPRRDYGAIRRNKRAAVHNRGNRLPRDSSNYRMASSHLRKICPSKNSRKREEDSNINLPFYFMWIS